VSMGSVPTLVRVFLCPCVGPMQLVGLTPGQKQFFFESVHKFVTFSENCSYMVEIGCCYFTVALLLSRAVLLVTGGYDTSQFRLKIRKP